MLEDRRKKEEDKEEDRRKFQRRRFSRFKIDQMINLSFGKESYVQVAGVNISQGGLFCKSREYVEPYTKVYIMVGLRIDDENQEIRCEGIVLRSVKQNDEFSIGISFTDMGEEDRKKLNAFILELERGL